MGVCVCVQSPKNFDVGKGRQFQNTHGKRSANDQSRVFLLCRAHTHSLPSLSHTLARDVTHESIFGDRHLVFFPSFFLLSGSRRNLTLNRDRAKNQY